MRTKLALAGVLYGGALILTGCATEKAQQQHAQVSQQEQTEQKQSTAHKQGLEQNQGQENEGETGIGGAGMPSMTCLCQTTPTGPQEGQPGTGGAGTEEESPSGKTSIKATPGTQGPEGAINTSSKGGR